MINQYTGLKIYQNRIKNHSLETQKLFAFLYLCELARQKQTIKKMSLQVRLKILRAGY